MPTPAGPPAPNRTTAAAATTASIPLPRRSPEDEYAEHWVRLLQLASAGRLYALPSPIPSESVLLVYDLPDGLPGAHGDHADAVFLRQLLHAGLAKLAAPAPRLVPNGDLHHLRPVTVTDRGSRWLATQPEPARAAALRPVDTRERTFTTPGGWDRASWSGSARTR